MKKTNIKLMTAFVLMLCLSIFATVIVGAAKDSSMGEDIKDAAEDIKETVKDAMTDVSDALDPDKDKGENGSGISGIISDTTNERPQGSDTTKRTESETEKDTTHAQTTDEMKDTVDEGENNERSINPWAVIIAIIAVAAVLILIFVLIPKRN